MADEGKAGRHPRQTVVMELPVIVFQLFGEGFLFDSRHITVEICYENSQLVPEHSFCERIVEELVDQAIEEGGEWRYEVLATGLRKSVVPF